MRRWGDKLLWRAVADDAKGTECILSIESRTSNTLLGENCFLREAYCEGFFLFKGWRIFLRQLFYSVC
jgi:hypothetical protein